MKTQSLHKAMAVVFGLTVAGSALAVDIERSLHNKDWSYDQPEALKSGERPQELAKATDMRLHELYDNEHRKES